MFLREIQERRWGKAERSGSGSPGQAFATDRVQHEQQSGTVTGARLGERGGNRDRDLDGVGLHAGSLLPPHGSGDPSAAVRRSQRCGGNGLVPLSA